MDTKQFAINIKRARENAGLTQDELSDKAGLAYSTLAKIEQGAIKNPSVFTVYAIINALGTTLEQLMGAEPAKIKSDKHAPSAKFVYCDMNGVMVRFYHHAFISLAEETNSSFDKVETTFWHYNEPVNKGEITLSEFNQLMAQHLGVDSVDWQKHYMSSIQPVKEMWACLEQLATKYRIGLLTNTMPGFVTYMISHNLLPKRNYDAVIDSSVCGAVKPEDEIYKLAENIAKCRGPEIFLIDDTRVNLSAAKKFGWGTLWFDNYNPVESVKRIERALLG